MIIYAPYGGPSSLEKVDSSQAFEGLISFCESGWILPMNGLAVPPKSRLTPKSDANRRWTVDFSTTCFPYG
jgi:hypothetical protein